MQMILDSILTLTKAEAAWLFFFLLVCVGIDRGVAAIGGPPLTFFALLAVMLVAFFVVAAVYTAGKWVLQRIRKQAN